MIRLSSWRLLPLFLLIAILASACGNLLAGDPQIVATVPAQQAANGVETLQMPPNSPDIANGARIFQDNCTRCHGTTGAGDGELVQSGKVPRMISFLELSAVRQSSVSDFYNMITNGNVANLMPPWKDSLSLQERWDVAMYAYTLQYSQEQIQHGSQLVQNPSTELKLESDAQLANATGLGGEDAYAAVAYERVQSVKNWGQSAEATQNFDVFSVSGTVSNGTSGYPVPTDQSVELHYGNQADGTKALSTTIDANNQYRFDNVPFKADYQYLVVVNYKNHNFIGDVLQGSTIQAENQQDITLYETTEDPTAINLKEIDFVVQYLTVDGVGTGLVITQQNIYENVTDRMFHILTPTNNMYASLLIQLPVGAVILNDPSDSRFIQDKNDYALVDLRPVYPGTHTVEAVYFIPYETGRVIDEPVNYRFKGDVNVVLTVPELKLETDNFEEAKDQVNLGTDTNPLMGRKFTSTYDLKTGESVIFDIEGQVFRSANTSANSSLITQEQILPILLVIVAVSGFVIVGIMLMLRSRAKNPQAEIDRLLKEIAELEALHEAGRINHDAFQQKRKALRDKVAQLMGQNSEKA